ncbi:hypothetical protein POM88_043171 [Heracleum sosnowskyi]|uniref:Uncharacterized protein n=1 Tax=Heracleum sosnowskyi TaxID=360622 RepID=A0AAD8M418_9APIA|nr:hypothetical protein POM88_043171 [Heracleum sosnowskyi]
MTDLPSSSCNFNPILTTRIRRSWIRKHEPSKRKRKELGQRILSNKKRKINDVDKGTAANKSSKRKRNDMISSNKKKKKKQNRKRNNVYVEEEDKLLLKRKRIDVQEEDKSSKRNDVEEEEEDKSSKRRKSIDDEAKEIEFDDAVNLSHDDEESEFGDLPFEEDDLEATNEAFIQIGDTDDLSHLLLGVVEDKSSLMGKCFQEDKCFQEETKDKRFQEDTKDDEAKETFIQIGDKVDLSDLLFTEYRDYLITCSHQDIDKPVKVKAKDLSGKYILLHFMYLTHCLHTWSWKAPIANLEDLYTKLHPRGDFEIVFVALRHDHAIPSTTRQCLQRIFSMMPPCPAIPLSDHKFIQRLERMFGTSS